VIKGEDLHGSGSVYGFPTESTGHWPTQSANYIRQVIDSSLQTPTVTPDPNLLASRTRTFATAVNPVVQSTSASAFQVYTSEAMIPTLSFSNAVLALLALHMRF